MVLSDACTLLGIRLLLPRLCSLHSPVAQLSRLCAEVGEGLANLKYFLDPPSVIRHPALSQVCLPIWREESNTNSLSTSTFGVGLQNDPALFKVYF
eukprot:scaffold1590_cov239-Pinguiococcus_pyrenoidosus.AAC.2